MSVRVDFHIHTRWSKDSLMSPETLVLTAFRKGLGAIAVTDHNEIGGALEALEAARSRGLDLEVIVGEEVKTDRGDVIGLFINELIPKGTPLLEAVDRIHEQGGLVMVPHPFDRKWRGSLCESIELIAHKVDLIEVINGRTMEGSNRKALEFSKDHGITGVAGSDAHCSLEIGKAVTIVDQDALKEGKIVVRELKSARWPPITYSVLCSNAAKLLKALGLSRHRPPALW